MSRKHRIHMYTSQNKAHKTKESLSNDRVVCQGQETQNKKTRWKYGYFLHGSTWCPGAEFKSIMAVAASMSDSGRGENMHDDQSYDVITW